MTSPLEQVRAALGAIAIAQSHLASAAVHLVCINSDDDHDMQHVFNLLDHVKREQKSLDGLLSHAVAEIHYFS